MEVPRSIFQSSLRTYTLNHCYFRAAKLYIDMAEANEELHDVIEVIKDLYRCKVGVTLYVIMLLPFCLLARESKKWLKLFTIMIP